MACEGWVTTLQAGYLQGLDQQGCVQPGAGGGGWVVSRLTQICIGHVLGDVRGNVMKWELPPDDSDGDDNVVMDHVATLGDAVRGLHMDKWSLTAVAYDGSCNVWDFWN